MASSWWKVERLAAAPPTPQRITFPSSSPVEEPSALRPVSGCGTITQDLISLMKITQSLWCLLTQLLIGKKED